MIQSVKIADYRSIEHLEIKGLRRVNLITGRNDCGKTSLLEAIWAAASGSIANAQSNRTVHAEVADFDGYWRPIFRNGDADRGLTVELIDDAMPTRLHVHKIRKKLMLAKAQPAAFKENAGWTLAQQFECEGDKQETFITGQPNGEVEVSNDSEASGELSWVSSRPELTPLDLKLFSQLKQVGQDTQVVDLLRRINDDIRGIELLSPTGKGASLFIRYSAGTPMLPIAMMGEGTQRCFEIAVHLVAESTRLMCLDEVENGLHHSSVDKLWRWMAKVSAERNVQVFATTHSEECIQTAARVFTELNDDGLCVIRLDRHAHETTAALYDKSLVEATERMGIEIRG